MAFADGSAMLLNRLTFCLAGALSIGGCAGSAFTDGTVATGGQGMGAAAGSAGPDQGVEATLGAPDAGARASIAAGAGGKPEVTPTVDTAGGAGSGGTPGHEKSAGGGPTLMSEGGAPSMSGSGSGAHVAGGSGAPVIELKGNASASSSETANPPGNANDGNPMTRWSEFGRVLPVFWQLDLGTSHSLSRVEIVWEYPERQFYGYTIGVSDDSTQFQATPAIDNRNNQSTATPQIAIFPAQVSGRYVRITVTSLPPNMLPIETWASMSEVRVFGR
jgi:hypothetical protein